MSIIQGFIAEGVPRIIVTADAAGIVAAQDDAQWRSIMETADLVTPDSVGVLWAAERRGDPIAQRVSGVDMVERLVEKSAVNKNRMYFLGAAPGIASAARDALCKKYPGANIVGFQDGFFDDSSVDLVVEKARDARPDILLVAMGIPKQEKFIKDHMYEIGAKVNMGVGGSFDVLSGNVKRAPGWMQRLQLEWLWRLMQNPKKWRKVAALPRFWWLVLRSGRRAETD
jgi:N-acetylglucosaminyldiphosphoundecaprenol N-acetyl-beta-D-mannosaminyltransferase